MQKYINTNTDDIDDVVYLMKNSFKYNINMNAIYAVA